MPPRRFDTGESTITEPDAEARARILSAESLAVGNPTAWFERLYAEAVEGEAIVPWDRGAPHPLLVEWTRQRDFDGLARSALVVGSGLGEDAELIASFGFEVVAFDISGSAIAAARRRFPDSKVRYLTADLLDPPARWRHAFELVIEIFTVQALPAPYRDRAIRNVAGFVGAGGTLLVIAAGRDEGDVVEGPPWPLVRSEVDAFAIDGLEAVDVEDLRLPDQPRARRWRATFRRPGPQ